MAQFSAVLNELRKWFQQFKWFAVLEAFQLHILFGSIGFMLLRSIIYEIAPYSAYHTLNTIFHTIPLLAIAKLLFFIGIWINLVSEFNVKYVPYALWLYVVYYLFPFTSMSLSSVVSIAAYVYLGYLLFRYSASSYVSSSRT